jgi:hypothetical protein
MSMASNYNTRPRAAEVLVDGAQARVVRRREAVQDLWRAKPFDVRLGPDFKPNQPLARLINPIKLSIS